MNLTLTLLAQTALLVVILLGWYIRMDRYSLHDAAEFVLAIWVAGGPLALAWLARLAVYWWWDW
jgi:hypothetical protein